MFIYILQSGIRPMWEDPSNSQGGKWVLTIKNQPELLNKIWLEIVSYSLLNTVAYNCQVYVTSFYHVVQDWCEFQVLLFLLKCNLRISTSSGHVLKK